MSQYTRRESQKGSERTLRARWVNRNRIVEILLCGYPSNVFLGQRHSPDT